MNGGVEIKWKGIQKVKTQDIIYLLFIDIYFHVFSKFSSMKKNVIFSSTILKKNLVLLHVVYSHTLPKTLNSAESGQLYVNKIYSPVAFWQQALFYPHWVTQNSSCPYDFNHSSFWNHNPLSPLFYSITNCLSKLMSKFSESWNLGNAESHTGPRAY